MTRKLTRKAGTSVTSWVGEVWAPQTRSTGQVAQGPYQDQQRGRRALKCAGIVLPDKYILSKRPIKTFSQKWRKKMVIESLALSILKCLVTFSSRWRRYPRKSPLRCSAAIRSLEATFLSCGSLLSPLDPLGLSRELGEVWECGVMK